MTTFPLPFTHQTVRENLSKATVSQFLVAAMYTPSYAARADRLRQSCERLSLPYALFEVAEIHNSISPNGGNDLSFTKPNFISYLLAKYRKPILYLDADCVVREYPDLIDRHLADGVTFAIYNWVADRNNETFAPLEMMVGSELVRGRYYGYMYRIGYYDKDQLICSGATQLHSPSPTTHELLRRWHETIVANPRSADDPCLDYAFNNGGAQLPGIRPVWLPKEYARCSWWIYARPVIDHPDERSKDGDRQFAPFRPPPGKMQFYEDRATFSPARFPENFVVDVKARRHYLLTGNELHADNLADIGPSDLQFWIADDAI